MTPRQIKAALFAIAVAGMATEAQADGASFTITVTIPPFAEAMAARDSGAAGDWTILSSGGGFLVDLPEVFDDEVSGEDAAGPDTPADAPLAVYRSDRNRFTLSLTGPNGDTAMIPSSVIPGENLIQVNYGLPQPDSSSATSSALRVVFAGL